MYSTHACLSGSKQEYIKEETIANILNKSVLVLTTVCVCKCVVLYWFGMMYVICNCGVDSVMFHFMQMNM